MVLLMYMIAAGIIAFIMMHAHSSGMATVQLAEYIFTIRIATLYACVVKYMLQVLANGCLAHIVFSITASKGDIMPARLLCCRCR